MELELKITCTCHQANITICCQTPLVAPLLHPSISSGSYGLLDSESTTQFIRLQNITIVISRCIARESKTPNWFNWFIDLYGYLFPLLMHFGCSPIKYSITCNFISIFHHSSHSFLLCFWDIAPVYIPRLAYCPALLKVDQDAVTKWKLIHQANSIRYAMTVLNLLRL